MSNIFRLSDPDSWYCGIIHLASGHGLLQIKLSNKTVTNEARQIEFAHAIYFSGWVTWRGADFRIGTDSEYIDVIRQGTPKYNHLSDQVLLNTHPYDYSRLFICKTVDNELIRIVANGGWIKNAEGKTLVQAF